jgi:hypothetical protein
VSFCLKQLRAILSVMLAPPPRELEDSESASPVEQFKASTLGKLNGLKCAVHGQTPVVEFRGATLRDIRISIRACCPELSARANRAIALRV